MSNPQTPSRVALTTDLDTRGRHFGDAMLRWSDNTVPLGYHPVPVVSLKGGDGPVLLLIGGTHGDEFEGPSAILRLIHQIDPQDLSGQIIAIPALNASAVAQSSRVTPLDGQNLNRAFPGDTGGGPTAMLAHFVETVLLPRCTAAVDLHSGGKASFFAPCALPTDCADVDLAVRNMELARIFGLPLIWRLGAHNDARSVNSAADRAGVAMIAAELGGGGGVDPQITDMAESGLRNILRHLGMLPGSVTLPPPQRMVEIASPHDSLYARSDGIFDRQIRAGQDVARGDPAGLYHFVSEPERSSILLRMPQDGLILAHTNRGMVRRGDLLALVVRDVCDGG